MLLHLLSTILLAPVLLLQGKYVRKTIESLPEPVGQRRGVIGSGSALRVLIVGDSAAAGVGVINQKQALLGNLIGILKVNFEVSYALMANTGDNTRDCIAQLKTAEAEEFDIVLISLGVNDVTSGCSEAAFIKRQTALIDLLQKKFFARQIILSGLPPMSDFPALPQPLRWYIGAQAQRFNQRVEQLARKYELDFIELEFDGDHGLMASDGFHPGPKVYKAWAEMAAQTVLSSYNKRNCFG